MKRLGRQVFEGQGFKKVLISAAYLIGIESLKERATCSTSIDEIRYKLQKSCSGSNYEGVPEAMLKNGLAQLVERGNGRINFPIRQTMSNNGHLWYDIGVNPQRGHQYLTLNSLGRCPGNPEKVMATMKESPDLVFPLSLDGASGQAIRMGNIYTISGAFKVKTTEGLVQSRMGCDALDYTNTKQPSARAALTRPNRGIGIQNCRIRLFGGS